MPEQVPSAQLFAAAERGDIAAVRRALAAGAAIEARDARTGRTPLMAAAASPQADAGLLRLLLDHGADVNARAWTLETAPEAAVADQMQPFAFADSEVPPELLTVLQSGPWATGAPREPRELWDELQRGILRAQWNGTTALILAATTGDLARVRLLLEAGADIGATTIHGGDALSAAAAVAGDEETALRLVALLLEHGADPDRSTTRDGPGALAEASRLARFRVVRQLLDAGAQSDWLGWSPLMTAVALGSLDDVRAALAACADLEARDYAERTALHLSLQLGDLAKAKALRAAGAALAAGRQGQSPLDFARHEALVAWLLAEGCDPYGADRFGRTPLMAASEAGDAKTVRLLLEAGADVGLTDHGENTALALAANGEVVRLLLAAGADLNQVTDDRRKALFGLPAEAPLALTDAQYEAGKRRRFGRANPEVMDEPFWHAMVRSRANAYFARRQYEDGSYDDGPVWCFERFGRTLTALPDGRYVEIAGEHEDFSDPDFCIYNDVVVYDGDGRFTIYGYPEERFPPTDFHTATLVGNVIYLIGSLGYREQRRYGETPVYRLSCATWAIEPVATSGRLPGWISRHTARYEPVAHQIIISGGKRSVQRGLLRDDYVDNTETYALDLATLVWW